VSGDHARQEQVWQRLQSSYTKEAFMIRRLLTEGAVRASDKRARFVGDAYEAAGGAVLRDLFQGDDGGWLQDVALVERLVAERLEREADAVRAEGWRWIEVAPDLPYGHQYGLRQLRFEDVPLTAEQEAERAALQAEYDQLEAAHAAVDELPEDVARRVEEIEAALAAFDERSAVFDPAEVARAGAFVSIDGDGRLRVERGYVRPEDEMPVEPEPDVDSATWTDADGREPAAMPAQIGTDGVTIHAGPEAASEPEDDEGIKPLPDRLLSELSAHRTLALRHALGGVPHLMVLAVLHALTLRVFYPYALDTCLDLDAKSIGFAAQAPGLKDTALAHSLEERHQAWAARLPRDPAELWDALADFDAENRLGLFAHCVGLTVNAVHEAWNRRPRALAHADKLAGAVRLDMAAAGWAPTVDNYLGRVTKARIVQAVREARGEQVAASLDGLKKGDMAEKAQELLAGTGWLPEPLRTPGQVFAAAAVTPNAEEGHPPADDPEQLTDPAQTEADAPAEDWSAAAE